MRSNYIYYNNKKSLIKFIIILAIFGNLFIVSIVILSLFIKSTFASFLFGFGFLVSLIGFYSSFSNKNVKKHYKLFNAEAKSCENIKEKENNDMDNKTLTAYYFKTLFSFTDGEEKYEKIYESDNEIEVNKEYQVYYSKEKDLLIPSFDLERKINKSAIIIISTLCYFLAIIFIIFSFLNLKNIINYQIFSFSLVVGIGVLCYGINKNRKNRRVINSVKNPKANYLQIPAKIIYQLESLETSSTDESAITVYSPIYEYKLNGQTKEYLSSIKKAQKYNIGEEVILYYNNETKQLICLDDFDSKGNSAIIIGSIFILIACLVLFL